MVFWRKALSRRGLGARGGFCYGERVDTPTLLARLKALEPELRRSGVGALYLFGSRARGDHREDSDVDLAFDAANGEIDLWTRAEIMGRVYDDTGFDVDLANRGTMYPQIREAEEAEMVQVF